MRGQVGLAWRPELPRSRFDGIKTEIKVRTLCNLAVGNVVFGTRVTGPKATEIIAGWRKFSAKS